MFEKTCIAAWEYDTRARLGPSSRKCSDDVHVSHSYGTAVTGDGNDTLAGIGMPTCFFGPSFCTYEHNIMGSTKLSHVKVLVCQLI